MKPKDKYDLAVEYLTDNPERIGDAWLMPEHRRGGCLFQMAGELSNPNVGCLTAIRSGKWVAATPELTDAIRNDDRLPKSRREITTGSLPIFAEWQRRIDKELGREV